MSEVVPTVRYRNSSLLKYSPNRPDWNVFNRMGDSDFPRFLRVFVLVMVASGSDEVPSVRFNDFDELSGRIALHRLHHLHPIITRVLIRVYVHKCNWHIFLPQPYRANGILRILNLSDFHRLACQSAFWNFVN